MIPWDICFTVILVIYATFYIKFNFGCRPAASGEEKGESEQALIKPCPFCGDEPTLESYFYDSENWYVKCQNCFAIVESSSKEKVIQKWNTRAPVPSPWVSVEERLPEKDGLYLVYREDGTFDTAPYWTEKKYFKEDCVSHWMPIPPLEPSEKKE